MGFAARAELLTRLGALRQKGALRDEQFDRLKCGVLNDETIVTVAILATLDDFWGLRCNGTLNDSEYRDQLKGILGSVAADVHLDGAVHTSSPAPAVPSPLQAQQAATTRAVSWLVSHCPRRYALQPVGSPIPNTPYCTLVFVYTAYLYNSSSSMLRQGVIASKCQPSRSVCAEIFIVVLSQVVYMVHSLSQK